MRFAGDPLDNVRMWELSVTEQTEPIEPSHAHLKTVQSLEQEILTNVRAVRTGGA